MNQFILNNENKTQFIQLIFTFVKTNQYLVPQDILQTDCVALSGDNDCRLVQLGNVEERYHLTNNQEEADTRVILYSLDVLNNKDMFVYLRSPSGDTDILVLALGITLCNTIFAPGFQALYFNCLCLKPMEKRLHSVQTLIL